MYRTVYTAQKITFCTEVYGLPVTGCTPDAVRTAINIQSTFQRLRESCLFGLNVHSLRIWCLVWMCLKLVRYTLLCCATIASCKQCCPVLFQARPIDALHRTSILYA